MSCDKKLKIMVLTAEDSLKVFRMTEERITAALERHPEIGNMASFSIVRTTTSYENDPSWNENDHRIFYENIQDADILVGYMFPLKNLEKEATRLRWIHIIGAGVEHLCPLTWLPKGVALTNNRGAHAPKTYEYAMMAILMLGNHIPRLATAQRESRWDGHFVTVVQGRTIVVLGAGKQGTAVARAAKCLCLRTVGIDLNTTPREFFDCIVPPDELLSVLPSADFVGITLPLTPETDKFIGKRELQVMKPEAGLFNISRGGVLDTAALLEALHSGNLSGAVLDVYETEPLFSDSPLWKAPNLIMTPHMGCDDEENYIGRTFDIVMENILRLTRGEVLENLIDSDRGY